MEFVKYKFTYTMSNGKQNTVIIAEDFLQLYKNMYSKNNYVKVENK